MAIYQNLSGTTSKTFKIGKNGPILEKTLLNEASALKLNSDLILNKIDFDVLGTSYIDGLNYTGTAFKASKLDHDLKFNLTGAVESDLVTTDLNKDSSSITVNVTSLNAGSLTGDVAWDRISHLIIPTDQDSNSGTSTNLARYDHKHDGVYLKVNQKISFIGNEITGSGNINDGNNELTLTITDGSVTNSKIKDVAAEKILAGTIGTSTNKVNIIGNAETATNADFAQVAENLKGNHSFALPYQDGETTKFLEAGNEGSILKSNGLTSAPEWVSQSLLISGKADSLKLTESKENKEYYVVGSIDNQTGYSDGYYGKGIHINPVNSTLTATTFIGNLQGTAGYATNLGDSSNSYTYQGLTQELTELETLANTKVKSIKLKNSNVEYNVSGNVVLPNYTEGANKVEDSTKNGNILVDGQEVNVYTLPEATNSTLGGVIVDSSLSTSSENPVQNKILTTSLNEINVKINTNAENIKKNADLLIDHTSAISKNASDILTVSTGLDTHIKNTNNPHGVTKDQVGLGNVVNVSTVNTLISGSPDNITSGAVYSALNDGKTNVSFADATIKGNLVVKGNVTSIQATNLEIKDPLIELYKRDVTDSINGYTGLYVKNYDSANTAAVVFDNTGKLYTGNVSFDVSGNMTDVDLLPIAVRNVSINTGMIKWDSATGSIINAIPKVDYTPALAAENKPAADTYIKVTVNEDGLVTNGEKTIDISTETTGDLDSARVSVDSNKKLNTWYSEVNTSISTNTENIKKINETPLVISGNVSGNINVSAATGELNINNGAVTSEKMVTTAANSSYKYDINISGKADNAIVADQLASNVNVTFTGNATGAVEFNKGGNYTVSINNNFATSSSVAEKVNINSSAENTEYNLVGLLSPSTLGPTKEFNTNVLVKNKSILLESVEFNKGKIKTTLSANNDLSTSTTVLLPSNSGTLITNNDLSNTLKGYLPLTGGDLSGRLKIYSDLLISDINPENNPDGNDIKLNIKTLTKDNKELPVITTRSGDTTNLVFIGGDSSLKSEIAPTEIRFTTSSAGNIVNKKEVAKINDKALIIENGSSLLVDNDSVSDIGSSTNKFNNIYAAKLHENNSNGLLSPISEIYVHEAQEIIPAAKILALSQTTVITGVSVNKGILEYQTATIEEDSKVQQTLDDKSSLNIPILFGTEATVKASSSVIDEASFNKNIYVIPCENTLVAPTFKGNLVGNADTATKATQDIEGNEIHSTYAIGVEAVNVETRNDSFKLLFNGSENIKNTNANIIKINNVENAIHADTATADDNGDNIVDTYSKKSETVNDITQEVSSLDTIGFTKADGSEKQLITINNVKDADHSEHADRLTTPRNVAIIGGTTTTNAATFDGQSDLNIELTNIDPTLIGEGIIGTSTARVDLVGNADTATTSDNLAAGSKYDIAIQTEPGKTGFIDYKSPIDSNELILTVNSASAKPEWVKNRYFYEDGSKTLKGTLQVKENQNPDSFNIEGTGINMNNSTISNLSGLYFTQRSTGAFNGINFYNSASTADTLFGKLGKLFFIPNRTLDSSKATSYPENTVHEIIHEGNYLEFIKNIDVSYVGSLMNKDLTYFDINSIGSNSREVLSVVRGGTGTTKFDDDAIVIGSGEGNSLSQLPKGLRNSLLAVNDSSQYQWVSFSSIDDYFPHTKNKVIHVPPSTTLNKVLLSGGQGAQSIWSDKYITDTAFTSFEDMNKKAKAYIEAATSLNLAGDLNVSGKITIGGDSTVIEAETIKSSDTLIELGSGRTTPIDYAGFYVQKYDGTNTGALVFDKSGTAYVGDVRVSGNKIYPINDTDISSEKSLQPIATRGKNLTANTIAKYDSTNKTLVSAVAGVDYVKPASSIDVVKGTYVKVNVNNCGLIISGEEKLNINNDTSGNLSGSRVNIAYNGVDTTLNTWGASLATKVNTNTSDIKTINDTPIKISGSVSGNVNVSSATGSLSLVTDAVQSSHIKNGAVIADKIGANSVTSVKIADKAVVPSKLDSELYYPINVATAKSSAWLSANSSIPEGVSSYFIFNKPGNNVTLNILNNAKTPQKTISANKVRFTGNTTGNGITNTTELYFSNSGSLYSMNADKSSSATKYYNEILDSSNYIDYTMKNVKIIVKESNGVGIKAANGTLDAGICTVDITDLIPSSTLFDGKYVNFTQPQNIAAKKSFGNGIKIGTNKSADHTHADSGAGCNMVYNSDKECLQFVFD